ncbi:hypothetical protein [Aquimarina pacifica]|uniref:hypothetical protein n=1 Tax=Aquimarina pacifica TaxID=1296415 RepID=UPI00046E5CDE|nr:hypothetical protein [Aquimarina pacifica]
MKKTIFLLTFIVSFIGYTQPEKVFLVEEKLKKRTIIYVQNDTEEDKSVFLKVNPVGYRKSAQRPIIKNIPAKSKMQMLILIPLVDVPSNYTYNLIINDELQSIDAKRNKEKELKNKKDVLF